MQLRRGRIVALSGLVVALCASQALAHIRLVTPPPRDEGVAGNDAHKTGPCGGVARTAKFTQYASGAAVRVEFEETIGHRGCFQIALAEQGDTNFRVLAQTNDPNDPAGKRTMNITLPSGLTCKSCTLQLRQLMINRACAGGDAGGLDASYENVNNLGAGDVYYSCADVCIGSDCPEAGAPVGDAAATSSSSSTSSSGGGVGSDGGASSSGGTTSPLNPDSTEDGGCSTGFGSSGAALVGMAALAMVVRRRRARRS
jgi:uncharacterized protein (TIGR03382 family)